MPEYTYYFRYIGLRDHISRNLENQFVFDRLASFDK